MAKDPKTTTPDPTHGGLYNCTDAEAAAFDLDPHLLSLMWDEPFYAAVLRGITKVRSEELPTAGVSVKDGDKPDVTDGVRLLLDEGFAVMATAGTYAWLRDQGQRVTREAAMAKMNATESAQTIIDMAVQMHGGMGVKKGCIVESLYREIRALRIYEGATEVQQLIIGRDLIKG